MSIVPLFEVGVTSLVAGLVLVPFARRAGIQTGFCARPVEDRWHRQSSPLPKTGGPAVFLAFVATVAVWGGVRDLWPVLLLGAAMFGIGLADDIRPARPATKLVNQLVATSAFVYIVGPATITGLAPVDIALTFTWIVGITNAFNLLDNIDGLAAGIAAIAAAFLAALIVMRGPTALHPLALASAALVGASLAFLWFNRHPASIFMGDSGSHLLGSFIAGATLLSTAQVKMSLGPTAVVPILILFIPILDTSIVTLTRSLSGRGAFVGGRDHLSHRLVALGLSDRRAVLVLYVLAAMGGFVGVGVQALATPAAWALTASYVVTLVWTGVYLAHVNIPTAADHPPVRPPLPTELTSRYRIYEVLLDAVSLALGYYLALVVRFHGPALEGFLPYFYKSLPLVVGLQLTPLWMSGKYRQVWRSLGPAELFSVARGLLMGVGASIIALLYLPGRFEGYSRSVFVYDALIAPGLVIGARVVLGALDEFVRLRRGGGRVAIIAGAGRGGVLALHEVLQNADLDLMPIGFVDDDPRKRRVRIEGLRVLGTLTGLPEILDRYKPLVVVVSIRDLPRDAFERICETCQARGVQVRRMRFSLEDVDWRDHAPGVVRFPGA